ncbi:hypothetical protein ABBQ32_007568 [Trebouxia sp. C0010 RCD-2024]
MVLNLRVSLLGLRLQVARTEVSETASSPVFANKVFVLQLPFRGHSNHPTVLTLELYAISGKDPRGMTPGDMQSSNLVAQAAIPMTGSLLDRLSKGDRIPVTAQLMPLVDTPADVWNQPPEPDLEDKQEVSLELMLLGCSPESATATGSVFNSNTMDDARPAKKALGCELLCHVARGADLPLPKRGKPSNKAPSVAVMACIVNSSQSTAAPSPAQGDADIRSNGQASASGSTPFTPAVTPAVVASSSPVWSHCLSCEFGDGQMQTGLLQLALLDEADGSVITSCGATTTSRSC